MKKNSSIFEHIKLSNDRRGILIINLISFFLILVFLVVIMAVSISVNFYYEIDNTLKDYVANIDENLVEVKKDPNSITSDVKQIGLDDTRIIVVTYKRTEDNRLNINICGNRVFYYLISGFGMENISEFTTIEEYEEYLVTLQQDIDEAIKSSIFLPMTNSLNRTFIEETKNNCNDTCYFRTLTAKVDSPELPSVEYVKIMMYVTGEVTAQRNITQIAIICTSIVFVLAIVASIFVTSKVLTPVKESLDKQLAFVSDASHELRTPLAIVQSKLENILTKSESTVYDVSDDIAISLKEVSRLNKLTNELLMLARDDNNALNVNCETIDLKQMIDETAEPFIEIGEINDKQVICNVKPIEVYADYNLLKQVIIILLDNAIRYTNSGDEIYIGAHIESSSIFIEIRDTGIGISEEAKEHLFERFYREDKARSRETGGNGLGLSIAWSIIKRHRGNIYVADNEPKGTKFIIELPKQKNKNTN